MIKLYDYEISGNCYKVRLLMKILGVPFESIPLDFYPGREHKSDWFLAINPLGQLPVLVEDNFCLRDSHAILIYLASKFDESKTWYPTRDPVQMGRVNMWLSFADAITSAAGAARLHDSFFYDMDAEQVRRQAHRLFQILDETLWFSEQENDGWLCPGVLPTIADIACFPYVMLSEEGGISRLPYPAIRRWTDRVKKIPGFMIMPGIFNGPE